MDILPCSHTNEGSIFACAQAGCEHCMEYLLGKHVGLIHACVRYWEIGGVPYMEAVEEGRIGLWRAILHYDPKRQVAFSTFAWPHIAGYIWRYGTNFCQAVDELEEEAYEACYIEWAEAAWQEAQIAEALRERLELLPERLKRVLEQVYGIGGEPAKNMAEIGREMGVTRERVRQLKNEGLAMLRLPAFSISLRSLGTQDSRQAYRKALRMNSAWQRSCRGKR